MRCTAFVCIDVDSRFMLKIQDRDFSLQFLASKGTQESYFILFEIR